MADLEKSVAIIFEGVDQMGAGVSSVTRQLDSVSGSVQQAAQPLADFTTAVLKAEAALLATGVAVTGLAIKVAGDFDSQWRMITTMINEPVEALGGFRREILDFASTSSSSLSDIGDAVYQALSLGVDRDDVLGLISVIDQLAIAGGSTLNQAFMAVVPTLNSYGAGIDEAQEYSDLLFSTIQNGATTLPELSNHISKAAGLASTAGIDFSELSASVSALTFVGTDTGTAFTQLVNIISSIINPTQQARRLAEDLGLEFDATALKTRGLEGVLLDVKEATGGSEEQMSILFGTTQGLVGALDLTGNAAEQFSKALDDNANSAGKVSEAVEKMRGDIDRGSQQIRNAVSVALINLGDPLLDAFGGIQQAIAEIFNAIGVSLNDGQLNQFVAMLEGVFQSIEQALLDVAANLPAALEMADWSGFLDGMNAMRQAVSQLFSGADLTSAEGLVSVIGTLGTAFNMFAQYTAGAIGAIGPFIEKLADLAEWVMKIDPEWMELMGTLGGGAVVLTIVLGIFSNLLSIVNNLAGAKGAIPAMTAATNNLTTALGTSGLGLVGSAGAAAFAIYQLYQEIKQFNDFRFGFSDELKEELDKTTGAQRVATEYSLFQVEKIAIAYNRLSDYFGWGENAARDFNVVSAEAIDAAVKVSSFGDAAEEADRGISEAGAAMLEGFTAFQEWGRAAETARIQIEAHESAINTNSSTLWDYINSLESTAIAWEKVGDNTYQAATRTEEVDAALAKVKSQFEAGMIDEAAFHEMTAALEGMRKKSGLAGDSLSIMGGNADDAAKKLDLTSDQLFELEKQMNQLASNERIKAMEFTASIKVAELEADAKKVEAILGATSTTVSSLAEASADMWSTLAGGDLSMSQRWNLERAIQQQLDIQKDAAEQQKRVIDAQIDNLRARTDALRSGDGLIKISSDGLEPALEMIMWQIIEKVQLRANAEATEFLVGINGGAA